MGLQEVPAKEMPRDNMLDDTVVIGYYQNMDNGNTQLHTIQKGKTMKFFHTLALVAMLSMLSVLAGCGGSTKTTDATPPPDTSINPPPSTKDSIATKASDFAGTWTGTYSTNVIPSEPFTLYVGSATDTTATGVFASEHIVGTVKGTFDAATGHLSYAITQTDGAVGSFSGSMLKTAAGLSLGTVIGLNTYGNSTTGSGSCTAPAAQAPGSPLNFAGVWNGVTTGDTFGIQGPDESVVAVVAADGSGNYRGTLTSASNTLHGALLIEKVSGYWFIFLQKKNANGVNYEINLGSTNGFSVTTPLVNGNPLDTIQFDLTGYNTVANNSYSSRYNVVMHNYDMGNALAGNWHGVAAATPGFASITDKRINVTTTDNIHYAGTISLTVTNADGTTSVTTAPVTGTYSGTYAGPISTGGDGYLPLTVGATTVTGTGAGVKYITASIVSAHAAGNPRIAWVNINGVVSPNVATTGGLVTLTAE